MYTHTKNSSPRIGNSKPRQWYDNS
jgi:hypothetical protein